MMTRARLISPMVALLILALSLPVLAQDMSASDIIDKALETNSLGFNEGEAQMSLIIEDMAGNRRVRKLDVQSKKVDGASRTRVELTAPKELKGQSFLFAENTSGSDDVWMYVPAFKVTRRIEGSDKDSAFLGSHFTYADLESRGLKDANYKRLDDDEIGEHDVYVIESTPKKGSESEYGKVVAYVRKSDYMPLKLKFYDGSGDEMKTLFVEKLDKTDSGKTFVERMTLRPTGGGFTTIKIGGLDAETDIPDSAFSKGQLGK
ncbi:MAG: outer membrane lipoprotein-sorting protein [Myxococcota bacterium]